MSDIRTTCPYCGVGCGLVVAADGSIKGDPAHPANFGRLCSKGAALGETLSLDGRLLAPRIAGQPASWGTALDLVAEKFTAAIRDHGPDSVAFYVSGQILSEDYYVANKLMKGFIGSANIDTNSRLCMASSVAGHRRAFGSDTVPGSYEDFEQADLVVLVGSNLAWCHPVLHQRLLAARKARPHMKLVVIDPRRTATCEGADLHLALRADGDIALFNGLLAEIAQRGAVDADYTGAHVEGLAAAIKAAEGSDPASTGLSAADLARFYDMWITTPKVVTVYSQGVNQSACGSDKVNAIINCHLATGRIGHPGAGPFSVTGQPNAMGGREVGGLANMLACHLDIENPDHRAVVQAHWQSPTICTRAGLKAVDMFRACDRGDIKALWIIGTNPAVSMPEADFVAGAIAKVPFTVISDITDTDTTALADVVLPATGWGEKTGSVTNSERRISLQRAFLSAPGQARPDWQILCDVARRMGWEEAFSYAGPADIFREYAALSGRAAALGRDFDIGGLGQISDGEYADLKPLRWPLPAAGASPLTEGRFFAKGGFFHADAKARMLPLTPPAASTPLAHSFRLNSGRIRDQWHTMTRTGTAPRLGQHQPEPFVEIHPEDAAALGVPDGGLAEVFARQARTLLRVQTSGNVARGTVFAPMHWSNKHASAGRINTLVEGLCDPVSGQPALKGSDVSLRPYTVLWHGFAASCAPMSPRAPYSAVARTATGWRCDMASPEPVADWEAEARAVLNLPRGSASLLQDKARGLTRVAIHDGEALAGLFFASATPLALAHGDIIARIGQPQAAFAALSGQPMANRPDPGAIICACNEVGRTHIQQAIRDGAADLAALGQCTLAGTTCGACKPELQALLDQHHIPTEAE